jgi:hypothetical protein
LGNNASIDARRAGWNRRAELTTRKNRFLMADTILPPTAISDALAGAKGAAAGLGADAIHMAEAATELPDGASVELVRHVAHTLQARAQRATLGALAVNAAAARLEAFAYVLSNRLDAARRELESIAAADARVYMHAVEHDGEHEPAEDYAAAAWDATVEEGEVPSGIDASEARAVYVASFLNTARK